nr:hypothetical protein CFP56_43533 [Quercus suber]
MQCIFYVLGCTLQIEDAIINVAKVQGMTDSIKFVDVNLGMCNLIQPLSFYVATAIFSNLKWFAEKNDVK